MNLFKHKNKGLDYYLKLPYPIILTAGTGKNTGWFAEIPDLPDCRTYADTRFEALEKLDTVKELWLKEALELGLPIPEPHSVEETLKHERELNRIFWSTLEDILLNREGVLSDGQKRHLLGFSNTALFITSLPLSIVALCAALSLIAEPMLGCFFSPLILLPFLYIGQYYSGWQEILPDLETGKVLSVTGKITKFYQRSGTKYGRRFQRIEIDNRQLFVRGIFEVTYLRSDFTYRIYYLPVTYIIVGMEII